MLDFANWRSSLLPLIKPACLVPCGNDKAPLERAWQQTGYTSDQIVKMGDRVRAVGINTAKANLVCVDLDGPDAFDFAAAQGLPLPPTWVIGRSNDTERMKRVYRVTVAQQERLPSDAGKWKKGTLEVFWRSQQFIVAGQHPSGGYYTWEGTPDDIANLPEEWVAFLPRRKGNSLPLPEVREIDLQRLLTRENSLLVDSGLDVGSRNNDLFRLATDAYAAEEEARRRMTSELRLIGTAEDLIAEALRRTDITGLTDAEIRATLASAREGRELSRGFEDRWSYVVRITRTPGRLAGAVLQADNPRRACKWTALAALIPPGWTGKNGDRKTPVDCGALSAYMEGFWGDRLRYNLLGYRVELDGQPLLDIERLRLLGAVQNLGYKVSDHVLCEALQAAAAANPYHPVREYLAAIDSDPAIPVLVETDLAGRFLGTTDALYDEMLDKMLLGAVWRAMEPGCKMDYVCVLQGSQGGGKTTFWQILFGDWFKSFNQEVGDKDSYMALHDAWGIELGELDGITSKRESARIKNFITVSADSFRPPYGRTTESFLRPSVLVATVNTDDFLSDITGERRWWVVPVAITRENPLDRDQLIRLRDSIWKTALGWYKAGDLPILTPTAEVRSTENSMQFTRESVLLEPMQRMLRTYEYKQKAELKKAVLALELVPPMNADTEIARCMKQLGWRNHRFHGKPRLWVRDTPEAIETARRATE